MDHDVSTEEGEKLLVQGCMTEMLTKHSTWCSMFWDSLLEHGAQAWGAERQSLKTLP